MPFRHDANAVGDTEDLRHLRGDDDDRLALLGHVDDQLIDLILCTYVDASRRFIHHKDLRFPLQPLAKDNLLLISAGQAGDHVIRSHALGVHDLDFLVGGLHHLWIGKGQAGLVLLQVCNRGVEGQVTLEEQAVGLALLGDHGKAVIDRFPGTVKVHQAIFKVDAARRSGTHTKNGLQKLGTSGAHQAVQAKDFALLDVKRDVLQIGRILVERC